MLEKLEDEVEQIITFIKESDNGRRWVDLTREFQTKRGWSHGKFVNHWKKTEPFREQRPTEMGKRYFIKDSCIKEATKFVLSKDLKEQELKEIKKEELPSKIIVDYYYSMLKKRVDNLRPFREITGKKWEFFGDCYARLLAERYSQFISIQISYPKGQETPKLNVNYKPNKKRQGLDILLGYFTNVAGDYQDKFRKPLPFKLLLIHAPPIDNKEGIPKEIELLYGVFYHEWLQKFGQIESEQTKREFDNELVKYLRTIEEKYRKQS